MGNFIDATILFRLTFRTHKAVAKRSDETRPTDISHFAHYHEWDRNVGNGNDVLGSCIITDVGGTLKAIHDILYIIFEYTLRMIIPCLMRAGCNKGQNLAEVAEGL